MGSGCRCIYCDAALEEEACLTRHPNASEIRGFLRPTELADALCSCQKSQLILVLHDDRIMSEQLAQVEVLEKVLEAAYRLQAYSYYGGKKPNAIRALRRRCPG